jgi:cytochrome c
MPSSRSKTWALAAVMAALSGASSLVHAGGDAVRGADVFKSECAECHSTKEGRNKKGPSLFQVVGRPAGQLAGFAFSDAMKNTGWTWDEAHLKAYLDKPVSKSNPGGKMKYDGLGDAKALEDVIAYLQTLH